MEFLPVSAIGGKIDIKQKGAEASLSENDLVSSFQSFYETLEKQERTAMSAMRGEADPHALVEAISSAQLAIETVAALRDKVVEAYQEVMRMPV